MANIRPPFVTAIMLTGHRLERSALAKLAIKCFERQTYQNRKLLIVNTGTPIDIDAEDVHQIMCKHPSSLGELRNFAIDHANGELLINWDDDDWYHPSRIADQVAAYKTGHIVLLRSQIRLNLLTMQAIHVEWPFGIFSTMLWPNVGHRFPRIDQGEDLFFVESFPGNRIVLNNPSHLYVRTFHGSNVCSENHIMHPKGNRALTPAETDFLQQQVFPDYIEILNFHRNHRGLSQ